MIRFEWNQTKAINNQRKHGVSFAEAVSVFYDENATLFYDKENSLQEDRYLMLGLSRRMRVLLVSFSESDDGDVIRLISARKATNNESRYYKN
ncbi:MAG: BrnT family toxin [Pseudomonadales bacterium]